MNPEDYSKDQTVYFDGEKHVVDEEYNGSNLKLLDDETQSPVRVNPALVKLPEEMHVTNLNGVGDGRAKKLAGVSINTAGHVLERGVDSVTEAGIDEGHAEEIVEAAEQFVN